MCITKRLSRKGDFKQIHDKSLMEIDTISKNGASLKSHMSRGNFLIKACFALLMAGVFFSGCEVLEKIDESNNGSSREKAISVNVGYSSSFTVKSNDELWFKFTGTGEPVIFETKGDVVDTYMEFHEGNATLVIARLNGDDNSGEGSNALLTKSTTSGTMYYIKVTPRSGTSGSYTFVVTAPTFNIRTNSITVAVGNSSSHVISSDGTHWFKFVGDGKRVFFETGGNVVTANIRIYIGDATSHSYNWNEGVNFITVSGQTYYISITGNSGTYTFKLRNGDGDGSSRYYAKEVTKGYSSSHALNYGGENWFIYQGTGEPVTFNTTGDVVDTYLEFYEGDDRSINWGNFNDNGGEGSNALLTRNTTSGQTYFIKITPRSGTSGAYAFVVQ